MNHSQTGNISKERLLQVLQNPSVITEEDNVALKKTLEEFPYFQAARAVRLKALKNQNSLYYNKELKRTAAYTIDRSVLFDFITSEEFDQNQIANRISTHEETAEEEKDETTALNEELKKKSREREFSVSGAEKEENAGVEQEKLKRDLKLGQPISFKKEENHSFSEWLKLTKAEPVKRKSESEIPDKEKQKKFELIDEFISRSPRIKPGKTGKTINLAEENTVAPEALMTETLARVYLEQKNYKKAIQAYKILILKNPEKSGFFADQIRAIKKLQEHNS